MCFDSHKVQEAIEKNGLGILQSTVSSVICKDVQLCTFKSSSLLWINNPSFSLSC